MNIKSIKTFLLTAVLFMLTCTANAAVKEDYFQKDNWNKNRHAVVKGSMDSNIDPMLMISFASMGTRFNESAKTKIPGMTAGGLGDFTKGAFNSMVKEYGHKYGLTLENADRFNPYHASVMAGEYMNWNKRYLERRLKRDITDGEIYMAHFLGAGGASRVLKAPNNSLITNHVSDAARVNNLNMFKQNGRIMTVGQFKQSMENRVNDHKLAYEKPAKQYIAQFKREQYVKDLRATVLAKIDNFTTGKQLIAFIS